MILLLALAVAEPPAFVTEIIERDHELPRYAEQYYHPLGRSPVVDALLADPMYSIRFSKEASQRLRAAAETQELAEVVEVATRMGGFPVGVEIDIPSRELPGLVDAIGSPGAEAIEEAWSMFLAAREHAQEAVGSVTEEQRAYLLSNPARWWFDDDDLTNYRYLTCNTDDHEEIFRIAAQVDRGALVEAELLLARAADRIIEAEQSGAFENPNEELLPFTYEDNGVTLLVGSPQDDAYRDDVDFVVELGGDDWYISNAGGTEGQRPAAFCIDLKGDDHYDGQFSVQGGGFLGSGALIDLAGDDDYQGGDYAQGGSFIGAGLLYDRAGSDSYRSHHGTQGSGSFGLGLLWDAEGDDIYHSSGMSLGNGGPQGVGVLVESGGDDVAACGVWRETRYTDEYGHGLGASIGVRSWPWYEDSSFYGGLGFVDDAAGNDRYEALVGIGSSYTFGAGVFVNTGGDDEYFAFSDAMGGSIHLGAAVMIEEEGDDTYRALDSAVGVGGDRGTGLFLETAGDDTYFVHSHGIGTGRKPKALGVAVEFEGDDRYVFGNNSVSEIWRPSNPENWTWATFADLGGSDSYEPMNPDADASGLDRGDDRAWRFSETSHGFDREDGGVYDYEQFMADMPTSPRTEVPWDPWADSIEGHSYRPLIDETWSNDALEALALGPIVQEDGEQEGDAVVLAEPPIQQWISALKSRSLDYDERRRAYECMDLIRFSAEGRYDWSSIVELLEDPETAPSDQLAFAGIWCAVDANPGVASRVGEALRANAIASPYARQILVRALGRSGESEAIPILIDRLQNDDDLVVQRRAAFYLGRVGGEQAIPVLRQAATHESPLIRYSVCSGLRDCGLESGLEVVNQMRRDDNLFVRRAACTAALSLGDATAMDQLFEEMGTDSIDTGWNYGRNLFVTMSEYVGPEPLEAHETDLAAWRAWWEANRGSFDLASAMEASAEKRAERLGKPSSSE